MELPINTFKKRLKNNEPLVGLWLGLANAYTAELAANADFDWLLLDGEHAPNDLRTLLAQLQAIAPYASQPIIRPRIGDTAIIKQLLDIGAQTLLIPMVDTAEQATELVKAMRYPPNGIRGVGSALARASRWNTIDDYLHQAEKELCLLVQIENKQGLDNIEAIVNTEGVDGVFIGPADLSASLGHLGNPKHPDVQQAIEKAFVCIKKAGKASGILMADKALAKHYIELGVNFIAVGTDTSVFMQSLSNLSSEFKDKKSIPKVSGVY